MCSQSPPQLSTRTWAHSSASDTARSDPLAGSDDNTWALYQSRTESSLSSSYTSKIQLRSPVATDVCNCKILNVFYYSCKVGLCIAL